VWVRDTARRSTKYPGEQPTLTGHTYDACSRETGHRTHLTSIYNTAKSQADVPGAPDLFQLQVRGRAVAYAREAGDGLIAVVDPRTGARDVTRIAEPPTHDAADGTETGYFQLYRLALGPGFSVAWHGLEAHVDPVRDQVGVVDGRGTRLVDSADFRSITHFGVRGATLAWTDRNVRHTTSLTPRRLPAAP